MRALVHRRIEFELKAGGIGELQRAALERLLDEGVSDAVLGKEARGLVEIAVIADLEAEPAAGRDRGFAQDQRVMLLLLAAAQIHRLVVAVLDMEADGVLIEGAALVEIDDIEHRVAAADDVERWVEDVCRNGHVVSSDLSFRGAKRTRNLEVPGSTLRIAPERRPFLDSQFLTLVRPARERDVFGLHVEVERIVAAVAADAG